MSWSSECLLYFSSNINIDWKRYTQTGSSVLFYEKEISILVITADHVIAWYCQCLQAVIKLAGRANKGIFSSRYELAQLTNE